MIRMIRPKLPSRRPAPARRRTGFTLIELLVVLVILGLLAGLVGPRVVGYLGSARSDTARTQIEQLSSALELYYLDVGRYPPTEMGLDALVKRPSNIDRWRGPYLNKADVPLDPWGKPYHYRYIPDGQTYQLYTLGADNTEGGDGENSDIGRR
jgi:general secretion pathway protein G